MIKKRSDYGKIDLYGKYKDYSSGNKDELIVFMNISDLKIKTENCINI